MDSIMKFIGNDYSLLLETIGGIVEDSTVSEAEKEELEHHLARLWLEHNSKNN